jgi:hypothetical protein
VVVMIASLTEAAKTSRWNEILSKLMWELQHLTTSMSVRKENEGFPEAVFRAFYTAVTAWRVTDWLWQSRRNTRNLWIARLLQGSRRRPRLVRFTPIAAVMVQCPKRSRSARSGLFNSLECRERLLCDVAGMAQLSHILYSVGVGAELLGIVSKLSY